MLRFRIVLSACLYALSFPIASPAFACPVADPPLALVDTGLSSIATPIEVYGDPDGGSCSALLQLAVESLPSRSLVPRPHELAEQLVPVAREFGAKTCEISVWTLDDGLPDDERYSEEACRSGTFRYAERTWWAVGEDERCW
ncbi:MAG TPA: hypothetical protein VKH41_08395 [Myxococcota bacterium]|nr:hypothetical protein [Myxococcota bacterium]